jgi:lactose/L-arabinose transport system substrate-binding protein
MGDTRHTGAGRNATGGMSRREFLRLGGAGLAGAALVGGGSLAGCGSSDSPGLTVASWDVARDALKNTIPLFKKKRPDTPVRMQSITIDYQQIIPRLQAGSGAPDIFSLAQQDFQNFLERFPGQFVDVTDRMERFEDQFAQAPLAHARKDGKLYAVPWDMGPVGMWYRKDLFEQAGIGPDDVSTYDDFVAAGKELQQKTGSKMTALDASGGGTNSSYYQMLLNQQGGSFYADDSKIDFTNEKSYRAMGVLDNFVNENIVVDTPTYDEISRAISNDDTATDLGAAWDVGLIKSAGGNAQKGSWDVTPLPAFSSGGPRDATLSGSVLVISAQSQDVDAAWDFIQEALLTKEGQSKSWAQGLFPSWEPYWSTAAFNKPDPYFGFAIAPKFADIARNVPALEYGPHFLDFQKPLLDAYASILTTGTTPEGAFATAEKRAATASGLKIA